METKDKQMMGVLLGATAEHQKAIDEMLQALKNEIAELKVAAVAARSATTEANAAAAAVGQAVRQVTKAAYDGAGAGTGPAVQTAFNGVAAGAEEALHQAVSGATKRVNDVAHRLELAAQGAELGMAQAANAFAKKAMALVVVSVLATWVSSWGGLLYQHYKQAGFKGQIEKLESQLKEFEGQVETLKAAVPPAPPTLGTKKK